MSESIHTPLLISTVPFFYAGPLRGIFSTLRQRDILRDVQSLILDGLSVTAELCHEIINDPSYSVRMLSIRGVNNLNHGKLRAALAYACRSSRPENTPRLKAIYVFGPMPCDENAQANDSDAWWSKKGRVLNSTSDMDDWAQCMLACQSLISFDAVLCQGPRHASSPAFGSCSVSSPCSPAVATFSVGGCAGCGKAPEGVMTAETHCSSLPLLAPPPILSSSVQAATTPRPGHEDFVPSAMIVLNARKSFAKSAAADTVSFTTKDHQAPFATGVSVEVVVSDESDAPRI
ncbi:hypothetical protein RAB80_011431 [Fusarium oxysporum f. sp. vasinfectum]|nr:hypothetical protein RAB80_011431 [Fusarium oxysporum f. sp. vasinfectum]